MSLDSLPRWLRRVRITEVIRHAGMVFETVGLGKTLPPVLVKEVGQANLRSPALPSVRQAPYL